MQRRCTEMHSNERKNSTVAAMLANLLPNVFLTCAPIVPPYALLQCPSCSTNMTKDTDARAMVVCPCF